MPIHNDPTKRGNLFVEYFVIFPSRKFSSAEREGKSDMYTCNC